MNFYKPVASRTYAWYCKFLVKILVFMVWFGYMAHLSQGEGGRLSLPFAITTCYAKACVGGQVKTAALFMYAVVQYSSLSFILTIARILCVYQTQYVPMFLFLCAHTPHSVI